MNTTNVKTKPTVTVAMTVASSAIKSSTSSTETEEGFAAPTLIETMTSEMLVLDEQKHEENRKTEFVKDLAKDYLKGGTKAKTKMKKKQDGGGGCCPTEKQTYTADGTLVSCHCDHANAHTQEGKTTEQQPTASALGKELASAPAISCLVVGDTGVGKTSFLTRHMTGQATVHHVPTTDVGVAQLLFPTNYGWIKIHTIDTIGRRPSIPNTTTKKPPPPLGGLDPEFYNAIQCVLILFDVTQPTSYKHAMKKWLRDINALLPAKIPKVLVGNKCDTTVADEGSSTPPQPKRKISKAMATRDFQNTNKKQYYLDCSVKSLVNIEVPFLVCLRAILQLRDLTFVTAPEHIGEEAITKGGTNESKREETKETTNSSGNNTNEFPDVPTVPPGEGIPTATTA